MVARCTLMELVTFWALGCNPIWMVKEQSALRHECCRTKSGTFSLCEGTYSVWLSACYLKGSPLALQNRSSQGLGTMEEPCLQMQKFQFQMVNLACVLRRGGMELVEGLSVDKPPCARGKETIFFGAMLGLLRWLWRIPLSSCVALWIVTLGDWCATLTLMGGPLALYCMVL